ncbi:MAG: phosphate-binding protein [Zetaproteobacteria bacterium CG1_02_53_45]|nr:MAG: phosphate-binding protein [Zetaproteobacteria bacterium CG1_02_53_45]
MKIRVLLGSLGLICFAATTVEAGVITAAGSTTVQPALKACSKAYQSSHADVQLIIAGGGSSKGVSSVGKGKVNIGAASRNLKDREKAAYPDLKTYKLGTDGVVMVVNSANSLDGLSSDQVKKLYSGDITNWSALDGAAAAVELITLGMEHGTYELFTHSFQLSGAESEGSISFARGRAWIAFSQEVALDKVAHDENAIAFASIGVASAFAEETGKIKLLSLDGVAATKANVANGKYLLVRPLLLLTRGAPAGDVKAFVDFALGEQCQSLVKNLGYIPAQ